LGMLHNNISPVLIFYRCSHLYSVTLQLASKLPDKSRTNDSILTSSSSVSSKSKTFLCCTSLCDTYYWGKTYRCGHG
jgi:hypothetical protein